MIEADQRITAIAQALLEAGAPGELGHLRAAVFTALRTGRHLITIRHCTCGFPSCTRPAARCDLDHTVPYHDGRITCECNLAPLCRQHHKTKQAQGWRLSQPKPGVLIWTTPHGRSYIVKPDSYPSEHLRKARELLGVAHTAPVTVMMNESSRLLAGL